MEEYCTGSDNACPTDAFKDSSVNCRNTAGICDPSEFCTGTNAYCPPDAKEPTSTLCRAAVPSGGPNTCDVDEFCDGTHAACPTDAFKSNTTVCRPATDDCDKPESCTGTSNVCPTDTFKASQCRVPSRRRAVRHRGALHGLERGLPGRCVQGGHGDVPCVGLQRADVL